MAEKWMYNTNGSNSELRVVLHELHSSKCYRCTRPKDYNLIEIDHIVPQNCSDAEFAALKRRWDLPAFFYRHDPSNLAPICRPCNSRKSDSSFQATLDELDHLRIAIGFRPTVITDIDTFYTGGKVRAALSRVNKSNPKDPKVRSAMLRHGPALVQKIALIDPSVIRFLTSDQRVLEIEDDKVDVTCTFSDSDRVTVEVVQAVYKSDLWTFVADKLDRLVASVDAHLKSHFDSDNRIAGESGPPHNFYLGLDLNKFTLNSTDEGLTATLEGTFEISQTRSVVHNNEYGDGLDDLQGDARALVRVRKNLDRFFLGDGSDVVLGQYELIEWIDEDYSSYV